MNHKKMFAIACGMSRTKLDMRSYFIGAVALRSDDTLVSAYNGSPMLPIPEAHCEARLCRKLDRNAIVYVARTLKNGDWAFSRPCENCIRALRRSYVKRVYYTIAPGEFGCIEL